MRLRRTLAPLVVVLALGAGCGEDGGTQATNTPAPSPQTAFGKAIQRTRTVVGNANDRQGQLEQQVEGVGR